MAHDELWKMTAVEAVARLHKKEITPLDLVEASAGRMAEVEPSVNAMPTLCLDRARDHARALMTGKRREAEGEAGWLAGLPVSIKDLTDVAGVRTTYGSPIFANHVPQKSHPLVERIERKGGIVMGKSNTPEFGAGGSTFNEVFGRTRNPWNTSLTSGRPAVARSRSPPARSSWRTAPITAGRCVDPEPTARPSASVRPSAGRVTRGTSNNLYSPQSVQGPMARNVADLALFLDAMAGFCPADAMTFDAPAVSFSAAVARPVKPARVAITMDFGGRFELDGEIREICAEMARRFEELGCIVEEASPDFGPVDEVFMALRSQQFVVDREQQIEQHRDKIKPDIIWNTELGLKQTASRLAWAERERAALFRRMGAFWQKYDLLVTPGAPTAAFDVNLRAPATINGKKLDNYMAGSTLNSAITVSGSPAIAVPCGFDQYGRPVGLQLVGKPRGEAALLQAASLYEKLLGLDKLLPIDPKPGTVPPSS